MASITKRRRWVVACYGQNSQRYKKAMKGGTTKDEARKEFREIESKIEQRTSLHEKKAPFFSEVKAKWLEPKKHFLRENTFEVTKTYTKIHFTDLDRIRINQITIGVIEEFISGLRDRFKTIPKRRNQEGYSKSKMKISLETAKKIVVLLNQIMAYAVRHGLIDYNPVRDAERPRSQGKDNQEKKFSVLAPDQIRALLNAVDNQKYRTLFLTAIMTGARQGEILGLKWSDIDFVNKQVCINRTFNFGRFFSPKTKGSVRRIDLAPIVIKELLAWKMKSGGLDDSLVFSNEASHPLNYSNMIHRYFRKGLKKAGIKQIRFHDLRHTYASLLLEQGENIKYIQNQLGHSSPTVTLNVYAHLMKRENQEAVCRLENSIFLGTSHKYDQKKESGLL